LAWNGFSSFRKTGDEINGNTSPIINNLITISINSSRVGSHSLLEGVRIILHEYIHADIYRKLNTKYDANGALDFNKTYETYGSQYGTMAVHK
jgi:hypothetical protein